MPPWPRTPRPPWRPSPRSYTGGSRRRPRCRASMPNRRSLPRRPSPSSSTCLRASQRRRSTWSRRPTGRPTTPPMPGRHRTSLQGTAPPSCRDARRRLPFGQGGLQLAWHPALVAGRPLRQVMLRPLVDQHRHSVAGRCLGGLRPRLGFQGCRPCCPSLGHRVTVLPDLTAQRLRALPGLGCRHLGAEGADHHPPLHLRPGIVLEQEGLGAFGSDAQPEAGKVGVEDQDIPAPCRTGCSLHHPIRETDPLHPGALGCGPFADPLRTQPPPTGGILPLATCRSVTQEYQRIRVRFARRGPNRPTISWVEHATENRSVGGSIPPLGTIILSMM